MVNASIGFVDNYLNNAIRILQQESKLSAMELLRVINQFTSRIIWVLMGRNEDESQLQNRLSRWILSSYKKEYNFLKN